VTLELTSDSTRYKFQWNRNPKAGASTDRFGAYGRPPGGTFDWYTTETRLFTMTSNTCDY
jgi:hypothetical protein